MLVLGRRLNESIIINDNIKVIVLEVNGRQVKLGFEAPPEISIHREEVFKKIQREQEHKSKESS